MESGFLYVVATPIGNLEDMTFRAVRILREVDIIAAEDTRHSRKLLSHFGISKPITSYFDHNKTLKGAFILEKLKEGKSVALISDAGTPCISDPGYQLVRDAARLGMRVIPVPGACAAIAALSASGLPTDSFSFHGFLPNRSGKRRERLNALKNDSRVLVFYEAPTRITAAMSDILDILGDRDIVVAREVSKVFEEFIRGTVSTVLQELGERSVKGEIVLMIAPPTSNSDEVSHLTVSDLLSRYIMQEGYSVKDAVRKVVQETGAARGMVYDEALRQKRK